MITFKNLYKTNLMRKYYFTIASLLFLTIALSSCSNEENKTQSNVASRSSVPVMTGKVKIGNQIWMTQNLNVSRYRNGDIIPQVTDPGQWRDITTGAWCYYNNDPASGAIYGKLYNWYAVNDSRGLAPAGWHIPSQPEFETLTAYLGGMVFAGSKLKSVTGWQSSNTDATNSTRFTGLPGGRRWYNNFLSGGCSDIGVKGCFWSSSVAGMDAYRIDLVANASYAATIQTYRNTGCAVRCIKN